MAEATCHTGDPVTLLSTSGRLTRESSTHDSGDSAGFVLPLQQPFEFHHDAYHRPLNSTVHNR